MREIIAACALVLLGIAGFLLMVGVMIALVAVYGAVLGGFGAGIYVGFKWLVGLLL